MWRIHPQILASSLRRVGGTGHGIPASSPRRLPTTSAAAGKRFSSSNDADPNPTPERQTTDDSRSKAEPLAEDSSSADTIRAIFRQQPTQIRRFDQGRSNNTDRSRERQYPHVRFTERQENDGKLRNSQENRFDNRQPVKHGGSGSDDRNRFNLDRNRTSHFLQPRDNRRSRNQIAQNQQSTGESKQRLRGFIEKLRQTARKSPEASNINVNEDETPAPIPLFQPRFLRHENGVNSSLPPPPDFRNRNTSLSPLPDFRNRNTSLPPPPDFRNRNTSLPPLPDFRNRDMNQTDDPPSSSRLGFRMPSRDTPPQRFSNPRESNRHTVRDDMQFLEGRQDRAKKGSKEQSDHNSKNAAQKRLVTLPATLPAEGLSLVETSTLFRIKIDDMLKKLDSIGISTAGTEGKGITLDIDTLEVLAMEFDIETVRGEEEIVMDHNELLMQQRRADDGVVHPPRPPVVCIMGHVDHGKTTLMDALRRKSTNQQNSKVKKSKGKKKNGADGKGSSDVAGTEAGGITQTISAFQVDVEGQDSKVTFLDTPGHAAFKTMRQSGSHAADVIVLVVAADDGVSEQTIEILDFYKSIVKGSHGGITMVVALNKIDKPGIEVTEAKRRIENQLLEQGIICEGMGGESEFGPPVQIIPTSGLTGEGLDELIEGLLLQSEVMDLRADHEAHAEGIVMDARMEKGLGVVADCIIRWGSIRKGDHIVSGTQASRVRMLKDVNDKALECGVPSQPVRLVGFKSLPKAGDPIICVDSEEEAEEMVEQRLGLSDDGQEDRTATANEVEIHIGGMRKHDTRRVAKFHELAGLEDSDGTIRIPIVVKADADGSLSAVRDSLVGLGEKSSHKVLVDPIQEGVGEITSTDIQMAKQSNACIFAFGLKKIDQTVMNLAESEGVIIRSNDIIYALLDDAKEILGRYLPSTPHEQSHGTGAIQAIFVVDGDNGKEKVAGLKVTEGNLYKSKDSKRVPTHFRVYRNGLLVSPEGQSVTALSLRHFKELVDSVRHGDECGLVLSGFDDFQEGDEVECYSIEMKSSTL